MLFMFNAINFDRHIADCHYTERCCAECHGAIWGIALYNARGGIHKIPTRILPSFQGM